MQETQVDKDFFFFFLLWWAQMETSKQSADCQVS